MLAETDVINMVSRGMSTGDILKGIHLSIAGRLVRLLRSAGAEGIVALTGGLAADVGLVAAIRELVAKKEASTGTKRRSSRHRGAARTSSSILAGAIGAALLGAYRHDQLAQARKPHAGARGVGGALTSTGRTRDGGGRVSRPSR